MAVFCRARIQISTPPAIAPVAHFDGRLLSIRQFISRHRYGASALSVILMFAGYVAFTRHNKSRGGTPAHIVCISHLKMIDGAVAQWALEQEHFGDKVKRPRTYTLDDPTLLSFLRSSRLPVCPTGGVYRPGATTDENPTCTIEGHTLDWDQP